MIAIRFMNKFSAFAVWPVLCFIKWFLIWLELDGCIELRFMKFKKPTQILWMQNFCRGSICLLSFHVLRTRLIYSLLQKTFEITRHGDQCSCLFFWEDPFAQERDSNSVIYFVITMPKNIIISSMFWMISVIKQKLELYPKNV